MHRVVRWLIASAVIFVAVAAFGALVGQAATPAQVRLSPGGTIRVEYDRGAFTVSVVVSGLSHQGRVGYDNDRDGEDDVFYESDGLGAWEMNLYYRPEVLRLQDGAPGSFTEGGQRSFQCFERSKTPGEYHLGCASLGNGAGPQGSGTLATVTLVPVANGTSPLILDMELAGPLSDDIPADVSWARVRVSEAPQTAPTPQPGATPTPRPGVQGPPSVVGGGVLGEVDPPDNDGSALGEVDPPNDGDSVDINGDGNPEGVAVDGGIDTDGDGEADGVVVGGGIDVDGDGEPDVFPNSGTGYQQSESRTWPAVLGGALAVLGATLLLGGLRLRAAANGSSVRTRS